MIFQTFCFSVLDGFYCCCFHGLSNGGSKNSKNASVAFGSASPGRSNIKTTSLHCHFGSLLPIAPTVVSKSNFRAGINRRSYFAPTIYIYNDEVVACQVREREQEN